MFTTTSLDCWWIGKVSQLAWKDTIDSYLLFSVLGILWFCFLIVLFAKLCKEMEYSAWIDLSNTPLVIMSYRCQRDYYGPMTPSWSRILTITVSPAWDTVRTTDTHMAMLSFLILTIYCSHRPEQDKSVNTNNYHERLFCLICFSFNRVIKPQPYSHTAVVVWPCSHSLLPSAKTSHKGEHEYHGNYFVVSVFHLTGSSSLSPAAIRRS